MRNLLFMLLVMTSPYVRAQSEVRNYRTFIEEGKTWMVGYYRYFDREPFRFTAYVLNGDTVIADTKCKKMLEFCHSADATDTQAVYVGALTENAGKVFFIPPSGTTPGLLYDFTVSTGDELKLMDASGQTTASADTEVEVRVIDERNVEERGSNLHCISIQDKYDLERADVLTYTLWIDGVGGSKGPLSNCHTNTIGLGIRLISCRVGGREIYDEEHNPALFIHDILSGIHSTAMQQTENGKYFDLAGRRLTTRPTKGLYIEGGRVRINNGK